MSTLDTVAHNVQPFTIDIPQVDIDELHARLKRTRFPSDYNNDDWAFGVSSQYLRRLVDHWANAYDWRSVEAKMNRYKHFKTIIDGVPVHFMRVPGHGPKPKPVILSHGWPWTFWDFNRVIDRLTDPASYGGDERDALELIVPSLPGFAFSTPVDASVAVHDDARIFDKLMREVLGFERYGAAGCDWGGAISAYLSHGYSDHLIGAHMTEPHFLSVSYEDMTRHCYGVDEAGWYEGSMELMQHGQAHIAIGFREPQTVAYALNDSPAGLAAWIAERRFHWAECRGDINNVFSLDDMCTISSIYWFTQSMGSSMRVYSDTMRPQHGAGVEGSAGAAAFGLRTMHSRMPVLEAPTGVAVFPHEGVRMPKQVAQKYANLKHWTVMESGGHWSPFEEPVAYSRDVTKFFSELT